MPVTISRKVLTDLFQRVGGELHQIFLSTLGSQVGLTKQNGIEKDTVQEELEAIRKQLTSLGQAVVGADFYKGKVNSDSELPTTYKSGWVWKVGTAGTYKGNVCEVGDMIMANTSREGSDNQDSDFDVYQANIDGAVIGPVTATTDNLAAFDGGVGRSIKDSGISIAEMTDAMSKKHDHTNKIDVLDKLTTSDGKLLFDGNPINDGKKEVAFATSTDIIPEDLVDKGLLFVETGTAG